MASNAVAERRDPAPIDVLKTQLTRRADEFKMVLPAHITPEKFQRVVATAAIQNPQLLSCDKQSLLLAAMKLAQDGLLPDGREAALVPFKSRSKVEGQWVSKWLVQAMPMVYGLRKKILQSGEVLSIETGVVYLADYENGRFLYEVGMEPPVRYRPDMLLPLEETTDEKIVAAYSLAKIKNPDGEPFWSAEVMRRAEIDKVRQASQTGAIGKKDYHGKPILPKGPWVDWYGEMARKTVLRRHAKVLPMSGDILETFERDIESEREAEKLAAEGAAALMSVETASPVTLPRGADLDEAEGGAMIDHDTGEVIGRDAATGMTELDEATARALDAGEDVSQDGEGADDLPAWVGHYEGLMTRIDKAKTLRALEGVERDWLSLVRPAIPDDDDAIHRLEAALSKRKREFAAEQQQAEG